MPYCCAHTRGETTGAKQRHHCARPYSHAPTCRRGTSELQGDVHRGPKAEARTTEGWGDAIDGGDDRSRKLFASMAPEGPGNKNNNNMVVVGVVGRVGLAPSGSKASSPMQAANLCMQKSIKPRHCRRSHMDKQAVVTMQLHGLGTLYRTSWEGAS